MGNSNNSNLYVTRIVRCTWLSKGKEGKYDFLSFAKTDKDVIEEAHKNVIQARYETFKVEIHKGEIHW